MIAKQIFKVTSFGFHGGTKTENATAFQGNFRPHLATRMYQSVVSKSLRSTSLNFTLDKNYTGFKNMLWANYRDMWHVAQLGSCHPRTVMIFGFETSELN